MKALSVRQPWTVSIAHLGKPVENRGQRMTYRGDLAIHACGRDRWDAEGARDDLVRRAFRDWVNEHRPEGHNSLPLLTRDNPFIVYSAIIAVAEVSGCHWWADCHELDGSLCTPWGDRAQWHIELANVRPLAEPVPCKGALGLWRVPDDAETAIRAQLEASRV